MEENNKDPKIITELDSIEETNKILDNSLPPQIDEKSTDKSVASNNLSTEQMEEVRQMFRLDFKNSVEDIRNDVKNESKEIKKDFLTIFGLFASFATFISIEVQIFKSRDNIPELIGVMAISLSFVMFFALVINDINKDKSGLADFFKAPYILNYMFIILGIFCLSLGTCNDNKSTKNATILAKKNHEEDSIKIVKMEEDLKRLDSLYKDFQMNIDSTKTKN